MSTETEALGQWIIPENSLQPDVVVNKNAETTSQAMVGIVSVDLIADADRVLLQTEYVCSVMVLGDSGTVLTGPVAIEYPALFPRQTVTNNTAETLTLRMDGTTGIALAAGDTTTIVAGLADVIETGGGGGGGGISDAPSDGTAYNRKDAAWVAASSGGGGGDLERLAQVIVTGSAVTDIDFTGLDLDADGIYQIEVFVKPGATGQHLVAMYYSGDTTDTNYYSQLGYFLTGTPGAGASAAANIFFNNILSGTANPYSFTAKLMKIGGEKPTAISFGQGVNTSTGFPFISSYAHRRDNTANVTSIKLRNTITNGFGVGTFVRLYRLN